MFYDQKESHSFPNASQKENLTCVVAKVPFFFNIFFIYSGTHHHFSMKLVLITVWWSTTVQCIYSFTFILVEKAVQSTVWLSAAAACPLFSTPFSNLYIAHAQVVIDLGARLVHMRKCEFTSGQYTWLALSLPIVEGRWHTVLAKP